MCGLFGAASTILTHNERGNVRDLGILNQFRGVDSTGIVYAAGSKKSNKKSYYLQKQATDSTGFFLNPKITGPLMSQDKVQAIIGHCRAATCGEITDENAHPYEVGSIIGAHNGTIASLGKDGKTDSYGLFEMIDEFGLTQTLQAHYNDAYALSFFNRETNQLNLIRNDKRPLWIAETAGTVYWSSEKEALTFIASRNNLNFNKIRLLPVNVLFTLDIGTCTFKERFLDVEPPRSTEYSKPSSISKTSDTRRIKQELIEKNFVEKEDDDTRVIIPLPSSLTKPWSVRPCEPRTNDNTKRSSIPMSELGITQKKLRIQFADLKPNTTDLFSHILPNGPPADGIPVMYTNHIKGGPPFTKLLRFKGFRGSLSPRDAHHLLQKGCQISGVIPKLHERIVWLNDNHFVLYEHGEEALKAGYMLSPCIKPGCLIYEPFINFKKGSENHV